MKFSVLKLVSIVALAAIISMPLVSVSISDDTKTVSQLLPQSTLIFNEAFPGV